MKKLALKVALLATVAAPLLAAGVAKADDSFENGWLDKDRFQVRLRAIAVKGDGDGYVQENPALKTSVDTDYAPEIDFTYFFTKNIAAELIAATSNHVVKANDLVLGHAWVLPPALTLQYHFQPDAKFSPYIGAGINYSIFYGEDNGDGFTDLDVDNGLGYALQAGFDYWMNDNWGLNLDVKYIDVNVDVTVDSGATKLHANDVDIDPWVFGAGVSYRF